MAHICYLENIFVSGIYYGSDFVISNYISNRKTSNCLWQNFAFKQGKAATQNTECISTLYVKYLLNVYTDVYAV